MPSLMNRLHRLDAQRQPFATPEVLDDFDEAPSKRIEPARTPRPTKTAESVRSAKRIEPARPVRSAKPTRAAKTTKTAKTTKPPKVSPPRVSCDACGHSFTSYSYSGRTRCPECKKGIYVPKAVRARAGLTRQAHYSHCPHCGRKL